MIDPTDVRCPVCGAEDPESLTDSVTCDYCEASVTPEEWVTSGINAMAGRLMRRRDFLLCPTHENQWTWDKVVDTESQCVSGEEFDTFEECVLDAYNHFDTAPELDKETSNEP